MHNARGDERLPAMRLDLFMLVEAEETTQREGRGAGGGDCWFQGKSEVVKALDVTQAIRKKCKGKNAPESPTKLTSQPTTAPVEQQLTHDVDLVSGTPEPEYWR